MGPIPPRVRWAGWGSRPSLLSFQGNLKSPQDGPWPEASVPAPRPLLASPSLETLPREHGLAFLGPAAHKSSPLKTGAWSCQTLAWQGCPPG